MVWGPSSPRHQLALMRCRCTEDPEPAKAEGRTATLARVLALGLLKGLSATDESQMVKGLNAVNDLARQTGTSMPMTALCAEIHRMLTAAGLGGEDQAVVMEFFKGAKEDLTA